MKKVKDILKSKTDLKVYLLFLLEQIKYPVEGTKLISIVADSTDEITIDYDTCLAEMIDSEHIWFDEFEGEKYYMISDKGRMVATELYDIIDKEFRERSLKNVIKHMSLSKSGAKTKTTITRTENGRWKIRMQVSDVSGEILDAAIVVSSKSEAERMRENFEERPDSVYRGLLFSATGRIEYFN